MCKVIYRFRDLQDNGYTYEVGDMFPHPGVTVSEDRFEELSGPNNAIGVPLISGRPRKATGKAEEGKKGESPTKTPKAKGKAKKRSEDDTGTNS